MFFKILQHLCVDGAAVKRHKDFEDAADKRHEALMSKIREAQHAVAESREALMSKIREAQHAVAELERENLELKRENVAKLTSRPPTSSDGMERTAPAGSRSRPTLP